MSWCKQVALPNFSNLLSNYLRNFIFQDFILKYVCFIWHLRRLDNIRHVPHGKLSMQCTMAEFLIMMHLKLNSTKFFAVKIRQNVVKSSPWKHGKDCVACLVTHYWYGTLLYFYQENITKCYWIFNKLEMQVEAMKCRHLFFKTILKTAKAYFP